MEKKKTTWRTGARRLLRLVEFLEDLPKDRFYYGSFVGNDKRPWRGAQDLSCGTTACALGWAATMPEFRRLGLVLRADSYGYGYVTLRDGSMLNPINVAMAVFGLDYDEAEYLFMPQSLSPEWQSRLDDHDDKLAPRSAFSPKEDATARQVARHIRRFVARKNRQRS